MWFLVFSWFPLFPYLCCVVLLVLIDILLSFVLFPTLAVKPSRRNFLHSFLVSGLIQIVSPFVLVFIWFFLLDFLTLRFVQLVWRTNDVKRNTIVKPALLVHFYRSWWSGKWTLKSHSWLESVTLAPLISNRMDFHALHRTRADKLLN